jgi:hypothetical protein
MSGLKFLRGGDPATPAPGGDRPRVAAYDLGSNSFTCWSPRPTARAAWSNWRAGRKWSAWARSPCARDSFPSLLFSAGSMGCSSCARSPRATPREHGGGGHQRDSRGSQRFGLRAHGGPRGRPRRGGARPGQGSHAHLLGRAPGPRRGRRKIRAWSTWAAARSRRWWAMPRSVCSRRRCAWACCACASCATARSSRIAPSC